MNNLITKDYTRKANEIPHGDLVYPTLWGLYPSKPGKIRVIIDCSAKFHERSLNKELLTGPDMANQSLGVLARFWLNGIAFMTDIEIMYY